MERMATAAVTDTVRAARAERSLLTWHRWGGLVATLVLLVAALTALPLVYKKQLIRWIVVPEASLPADYGVQRMAADLDVLAQRVPGMGGYLVKAPNPEEPYWMLTAADGTLNLYALDSLQPVHDNEWLLHFLEVVRELHVELMLGLTGEYLLLLAALIAVALGITGLVLWWPARRGFRLRWILPSPKQFKVQMLMQYHRHSGALTSLIVTLVSLTGVLLLWQSLVFPLLPPQPFAAQAATFDSANAAPSAVLQHAYAAFPDAWPTYIRLGEGTTSEASVRFRLPGEWHPNGRSSVVFDKVSGNVRVSERSDAAALSRRLVNQAYPLHAGYGMNAAYLFAVFVSGVALLWLAVTGLISYLRRLGLRKD